jgi:anti-anti-sigma regulatory factor
LVVGVETGAGVLAAGAGAAAAAGVESVVVGVEESLAVEADSGLAEE